MHASLESSRAATRAQYRDDNPRNISGELTAILIAVVTQSWTIRFVRSGNGLVSLTSICVLDYAATRHLRHKLPTACESLFHMT